MLLVITQTTRHAYFERQNFKMESSTHKAKSSSGPAIYGLGFIGALIYFLQAATTFWIGVISFLKELVWPAFLFYYLLEFLKK